MKETKKLILFSMLFLFSIVTNVFSQSTPKPTSPTGSYGLQQVTANTFEFFFNSEVIYKYDATDGGYATNSGATFHGIMAKASNGNWFYPSNVGGISAALGGAQDIKPWDTGVTFNRIYGPAVNGLTVTTRWRMTYNNDYIDYEYKITISGKTLIIDIEVLNNSTKATGLEFDRCEDANSPRNVRVPYLTYFNLLYNDGSYTSLFVDWEQTSASEIIPFHWDEYPVTISNKSIRFAQKIKYYKKTNGYRNPLKETVYMTVSSTINEVLPNLVGDPAPNKAKAASKTVLSYTPPYTWLSTPPSTNYLISAFLSDSRYSSPECTTKVNLSNVKYNSTSYKLLDLLKEFDVEGLNVIIKQYQYYGYDIKLPDVLVGGEPSSIDYYNCGTPGGGGGSSSAMLLLRNHMVNDLGYGFGLHEQYVDYYPNSPTYATYGSAYEAKESPEKGGGAVLNWTNCESTTAHVFEPSSAPYFAYMWSGSTYLGKFSPTFSYLDVHSALDPSTVVDYENGFDDGQGKFVKVLEDYRQVPGVLRNNYSNILGDNVPIQGEGGKGMMFYVGYFDDLEARLYTADYTHYGYKVPLLVDFDLYKMHSKSALHGVGHFNSFFASTYDDYSKGNMTTDETLTYIASELAYGHSGLISKGNEVDHTVEQAVLEYEHVYPSQLLISNSTPSSITYYRNNSAVGTASEYIKNYPGWDNYDDNTNFMSQVRVVYSNNIRVYVNRDRDSEWNISSEVSGLNGRFFYNVKNGSGKLQGVVTYPSTPPNYTLAKENGWMIFVPSSLISQLQKGSGSGSEISELSISENYVLYNSYPNPFNPTTIIKYSIPLNSFVTLKVYDILGREVKTLVNELKNQGVYEVTFNGENLSSGTYFYRITAGSFSETKKFILMK